MNFRLFAMTRLLIILVFLFSTFFAKAQDTLSLAHAVAIGLDNNFNVQIGKLNIDIASNNNTWGQAGLLPTINLIPAFNNSIVQRKPANPFAVAGRNISDNLVGQLDAQFVLFDGFSVRLNKQRLEQLEELSYGNAAFVLENTVQGVILGYYTTLLEKKRLQILKINLAFSKERYDYVKLRKDLGSAITFDVLQEQNNYLTDSANVLQQQIRVKNAFRSLNLLLNEPLATEYKLTDSLQYESEVYAYEDLRIKMVSSNTNLQNQYINQEILRNNTRNQQSNNYPSLTLNLGATGSLDQLNAKFRPTEGGVSIRNPVPVGFVNDDQNQPVYGSSVAPEYSTKLGNSYGGYANLGMRWTLFNGGQIKRSIENAQVQEKIGQLTTDQLKLSVENDLLNNFDLYNLRRQLVQIAQTKLNAAELNIRLANERYKNGTLSAIDLRIVQENYRNSALENYQAIYNSIASKIDLIRLTGGLVDKKNLRNKK
jgi:outer membrane protein